MRTDSGKGSSDTTSETAKRPPGRRRRWTSRYTAALSGAWLMAQFETTTSAQPEGSSTAERSLFTTRALGRPASSSVAAASMRSFPSTPVADPLGPVRSAARATSPPRPQPRSTTSSPSRGAATSRARPQERDSFEVESAP